MYGPDKASFEAAREDLSADTGTPYPNCTDQELYDLRHLHEYSNKHFRHFPYHRVPMAQATLELEDHLRHPSNSAQAAMDRVQQAVASTKMGVDLPIKAFHDLDRAFFGGYMKGRVRIRWKGSEENLYEAIGRDHPRTFGITKDLRSRRTCPIPIAEIILNARMMFLDPTEHSKRREMWGTTLHEMVHAYLLIRCGTASDRNEEAMGLDGGHGRYFSSCARAVSKTSGRILGLKVHFVSKNETH